MNRPLAFIAIFVVGALVMFLFDAWFTLLIGMTIQIVAVVLGIFEIARPEFLEGDDDGDA
jgi:multisubunit Na+/H+ antiporter MnhC subunit